MPPFHRERPVVGRAARLQSVVGITGVGWGAGACFSAFLVPPLGQRRRGGLLDRVAPIAVVGLPMG